MSGQFQPFLFFSAFVCLLSASRAEVPMHLVSAYPNLVFDDVATALAVTKDGSEERMLVGFQKGQVRALSTDRNSSTAPLFLDFREKIQGQFGFDDGLHGLAFHPSFETERRIYVCYSRLEPRRTILSEFHVPSGDDFKADEVSERVLLEYPHPLGNHWGGGVSFGPNGFLYLGIGDGGLRDDPYRLGQNLWTLHGKILRIDITRRGPTLPYGIPADNPFVDRQEVRDEIWAFGIRNPWGLAFDWNTGALFCADVGQDTWEEVNLIQKGGNYGWSDREGQTRFTGRKDTSDVHSAFLEPIHHYSRTEGISVTGGYVYRGHRLRGLIGNYVFGDWGSGKVWALTWDPKTRVSTGVRQLYASKSDGPRFNPTVIAPDHTGELLIFSHQPSVIYTLAEPPLLADAEITEETPAEETPAVEEISDPSTDADPVGGAS